MICKPCREKDHKNCDNQTRGLLVAPASNNWCDCQHVTDGNGVNRSLVPGPVVNDA